MDFKTLLYQTKLIKKKIDELHLLLQGSSDDRVLQELFVQLELLQSKKVNINNINNQVKVKIGEEEVLIATVVILKNTVKAKIEALTFMITDIHCSLDKVDLMEKRDILHSEYILVSNKIDLSDLTVKLGE